MTSVQSKLLLILPVVGLLLNGNAYAVYTGGANPALGAVAFNNIEGYNNFSGSSPTQMTSDLLSIISTAGWETGSSIPSGFIYQGAIRLNNDQNVYADPQVWDLGTEAWGCNMGPNGANSCPVLDYFSSTNYAYQNYYWTTSGGKNVVNFYSEVVDTSGIAYSNTQTYTPSSYGDNSNAFADGEYTITCGTSPYHVRLLQLGAESDSSTQNWYVKQYSMDYQKVNSGGTVYLSNLNVNSISDDGVLNGGSWINWQGTSPNCGITDIGGGLGAYKVNEDSHHDDSNTPYGTVTWWPVASGGISDLTQLWP